MWCSKVWRPRLFLACDHIAGSEITDLWLPAHSIVLVPCLASWFHSPQTSFWFWLWKVGFLHYSTVLGYQHFSLGEPNLFSPFRVPLFFSLPGQPTSLVIHLSIHRREMKDSSFPRWKDELCQIVDDHPWTCSARFGGDVVGRLFAVFL